jgi:hypothetical protein
VVVAVAPALSAKSERPFLKSRNLSDAFRGGVFGILEKYNPKIIHILNKLL